MLETTNELPICAVIAMASLMEGSVLDTCIGHRLSANSAMLVRKRGLKGEEEMGGEIEEEEEEEEEY